MLKGGVLFSKTLSTNLYGSGRFLELTCKAVVHRSFVVFLQQRR